MRLLLPLLALTVIWAEPLHAHGLGEAEARYRQGDFLVAAELGRTLASTDGDTLAARATLVEAALRAQKDDQSRLFELAAADARRALARDPEHVDAHLQLALALGHLGELNGPIEAHLQGYAREGRRHLDRALVLDPDHPWAHGALGMWHLQIVRHAGPALAGELYGATAEKGLAHCVRALELAPESIGLRFGCGVSLLAVGRGAYGRPAADLLRAALRLPPRDAAERLVQRQAQRLLGEAGGSSD